ncbi:hypothetical protein EJ05DRAFT_143672 [Pseudovirgaria hyperparasitica]|uniref:CUE domain-containing protein n=1 Tax=Pseudovirgaria hyperparasitica TaxID=470096 RepID=A0A6A6VW96_9PEZI|nr:uncharacterized protein EJ05DRAFT_143672 [Pseudovirgaria hyperparasitica]KAF2754513.1 hypothetical protein EJ05DRAFT_143672 [Pseudovirgaria hyperparasitica]
MSPKAQAEATLIEAFPSVDAQVVRAVLHASGGRMEPAFEALLGMSDPNYKEEAPPQQPPRPTAAQKQLEEDERLARQLAEHYQAQGQGSRSRGAPQPYARSQRQEPEDRERSFFDDDLPEIGENIRKGFLETQKNVNKWITDFKKKIDGEDEDEYDGRPSQRQNFGASQSDQLYGIQRDAERRARQSGDRDRYDADPQIISDDFTTLRMQDNDPPAQPPRPGRPHANPDLFKPTPAPPQSGPVDEVEAFDVKRMGNRQPSPGGNKKKWQPLTSVAPNPEGDDHDPFSLGDSEDEDTKAKDTRADDSERLKKAAATGPSVSPIEAGKPVEAAERSGSMGTRNKEAEELLTKETK